MAKSLITFDMLAQFSARKAITNVPTGLRAMDEKQMYNAVRGKPIDHAPVFHLVHNTYAGDVWVNEEGEPI